MTFIEECQFSTPRNTWARKMFKTSGQIQMWYSRWREGGVLLMVRLMWKHRVWHVVMFNTYQRSRDNRIYIIDKIISGMSVAKWNKQWNNGLKLNTHTFLNVINIPCSCFTCKFYYQLPHNTFYSYIFRLPVNFSQTRTAYSVSMNRNMYINYLHQ